MRSKHARALDMSFGMIAPRWLLCAFLCILPAEVTVRVWDAMICAQEQAPRVLLATALGLMKLHEDRILACGSFIELAQLLQVRHACALPLQ